MNKLDVLNIVTPIVDHDVLRAGYGYWDTTTYPYGGCFRRAEIDTPIVLTGEQDHKRGVEFRFRDGRTIGWTTPQGIHVNRGVK